MSDVLSFYNLDPVALYRYAGFMGIEGLRRVLRLCSRLKTLRWGNPRSFR